MTLVRGDGGKRHARRCKVKGAEHSDRPEAGRMAEGPDARMGQRARAAGRGASGAWTTVDTYMPSLFYETPFMLR